jgi:hypothetical protein
MEEIKREETYPSNAKKSFPGLAPRGKKLGVGQVGLLPIGRPFAEQAAPARTPVREPA